MNRKEICELKRKSDMLEAYRKLLEGNSILTLYRSEYFLTFPWVVYSHKIELSEDPILCKRILAVVQERFDEIEAELKSYRKEETEND